MPANSEDDLSVGVTPAEEVADVYITAWRAALTQEGRYLWPKPVFEGVETGVQLLHQVSMLTPFLWYAEKRLPDDAMKVELRNAYRAMRHESDTISQVEFLATHGSAAHLKQMEQLLRTCQRMRFQHDAVMELEARKNMLEASAAERLLRKELGGRAQAYNILGAKMHRGRTFRTNTDGGLARAQPIGVLTQDGNFRAPSSSTGTGDSDSAEGHPNDGKMPRKSCWCG